MENPERLFRSVALCGVLWALVFCSGCTSVPVSYVVLPDAEAVTLRYRALGGRSEGLVGGFSRTLGNGVCEVTYRADVPNRERCIRHEIDHCLFGDYHPGRTVNDC